MTLTLGIPSRGLTPSHSGLAGHASKTMGKDRYLLEFECGNPN